MQGMWVQSLVGELRPHVPWSNWSRRPQLQSLRATRESAHCQEGPTRGDEEPSAPTNAPWRRISMQKLLNNQRNTCRRDKEENSTITATDAQKSLNILGEYTSTRVELLQPHNQRPWGLHIMLNGGRLNAFSLRWKTKQVSLLSAVLFDVVLKILATKIR